MIVAAIALTLPIFGALVYLPWPVHPQRYAAPFTIGPAMLLAFAVTYAAGQRSGRADRAIVGLLAALAIFGSLRAREETDIDREMRRADARFVSIVRQRATEVHAQQTLAVGDQWCPWCWLITSYVRTLPLDSLPPLRVASCRAMPTRIASGLALVIVARLEDCPALGAPHDTILWRRRPIFTAHPALPPDGVTSGVGVWMIAGEMGVGGSHMAH
jgi:hypothetical protein